MFPDVCEALSLGHLARGDATSAMVASEWYMRNTHFPGWARPYEFASELFRKVGAVLAPSGRKGACDRQVDRLGVGVGGGCLHSTTI
jgi:hypothetical protein